jgi:hypothetical protein
MLFLDLENRSGSALRLDSVSFPGRGSGRVIRIIEVKIAPDVDGNNSVPGGAYQTDPPVNWWAPTRSCGKQLLVRVKDFRLAAGAIARVWIVLEARAPGQFYFGHVVRYTQAGSTYQERIRQWVKGTVAVQAKHVPMDPSEERCIKITQTRLLPYP